MQGTRLTTILVKRSLHLDQVIQSVLLTPGEDMSGFEPRQFVADLELDEREPYQVQSIKLNISLGVRDGKVLNAYGPMFWCHTKGPLCRFIQDVRELLLPLFMPTYTLDARSSSDVEGRPDTLSTWIRNQLSVCERHRGEKHGLWNWMRWELGADFEVELSTDPDLGKER